MPRGRAQRRRGFVAAGTAAVAVLLLGVAIVEVGAVAPMARDPHTPQALQHTKAEAHGENAPRSGQTGATTSTPRATPTVLSAPPGYTSSQVIFDDRFDGRKLNRRKWVTYLGAAGVIWNNDRQLPLPYSGPTTATNGGSGYNQAMYGPSQVRVDNGLILTAQPNTNRWAGTFPWISGVVTTEGKFTLPKTGWYVQVEAKMPPASPGVWPVIWFLPPVGGTSFNEMDAFEGGVGPTPTNDIGSSNYFAQQGQQGYLWKTPEDVNMSAGYHVYGFQWIPGQSVTAFFDGHEVWQALASSSVTITPEPYEIILAIQIASQKTAGWHSFANASTKMSSMDIAEVQAYS
jgi:hypothetical protein